MRSLRKLAGQPDGLERGVHVRVVLDPDDAAVPDRDHAGIAPDRVEAARLERAVVVRIGLLGRGAEVEEGAVALEHEIHIRLAHAYDTSARSRLGRLAPDAPPPRPGTRRRCARRGCG